MKIKLLITTILLADSAYCMPPFPCIPDDSWSVAEYIFCPTLTTTLLPLFTYNGSEKSTDSLDSKKLLEAKSDANAYVASNGEKYHTAKLENALIILREKYPNTSDMKLAKAILAF